MKTAITMTLLVLLLLSACSEGTTLEVFDSSPDKAQTAKEAAIPDQDNKDYPIIYACNTIDILFVIDNSNTMELEQNNLITNFPKFIQTIEAITPPIKSYHVGVICTDIGAGPYKDYKTCQPGGDDGKLQHAPKGTNCDPYYVKWLKGPGATKLAKDFGCIAQLGLGGCGFEQQMESALRALSNHPYNKGFIRKDAPLAIIFITDEDDCSAKDLTIFDPKSTDPLPSRCIKQANKLHPVSRYINAFKGLKTNTERVVVAAITGPPGKAEVDPLTNLVKPICTSTLGTAAPGNRFYDLIKGFGTRGVLESICQGDLATSLQVVGKAIEKICLK